MIMGTLKTIWECNSDGICGEEGQYNHKVSTSLASFGT